MRTKIYYDEGARGFLMVMLISQLFFTNGFILFAGMLIFFMLFNNLQQPYKPAVFTIMLFYHFIQISAGVWQSNYLGEQINYRSNNTDYAIMLSFVGLIALFLPIIYYQNKIPVLSRKDLIKHADRLSIDKTFRAYVIAFFAMNALTGVAFLIPSLTQIIFSLGNIKWMLFLLFAFQSILKKRRTKEFIIFSVLEFAMGFYSYFSEFKTVIFYVLFLFLCLIAIIRFNKMIIAALSITALVIGGVFWTSIKGEYRNFINKGSKSQSVQVEKGAALDKLLELSQKQDASTFDGAMEDFLDRLQYTYHLAKTMDHVPSVIPYQNGNNWGTTLTFVLTPRVLNADKGTYDASVKASTYTGIQYMGVKRGVSVSLGYFADGYIDFGPVGMFIPLLILGFIYGRSYFYFVKNSSDNFIFNYSVVAAMFMELFAFESDSIFLFGRLYVNILVFFFLRMLFFPKLMAYIRMPAKTQEQIEREQEEKAVLAT